MPNEGQSKQSQRSPARPPKPEPSAPEPEVTETKGTDAGAENPSEEELQRLAEEQEPTYAREYLIRNARSLLKSSRALAAGALATAKGNKKNFTIDEASALLKEYRKRKVAFVGAPGEDQEDDA